MIATLQKKLTIRYVLALTLIAIVITFTYLTLMAQIRLNAGDAYIINISGMQRMLSQRIALFSREVIHSDSAEEAEIYAEKMRVAVEKMISNHNELVSGNLLNGNTYVLSEQIKRLYFQDKGIHESVENYSGLAKEFLASYAVEGKTAPRTIGLMEKITIIARNGLLSKLNSAVSQYQKEAEAKIKKFEHQETLLFVFGILVLLLEVLFIFKPMVRNIVTATDELQRANSELTEFSYRISHDLRAPITSSLGLVHAGKLFLEQENKEQLGQSLDHMQTSLERLEELIDDVTTLIKMKQTDVEDEDVLITEVLKTAFEKLNNMPHFERIEIRQDIGVISPLRVKKMFFQQTLENLISNAVKYYDPEKEQPYIEISAQQKKEKCVISMRDNGLGIPEKHRDKLFGMFQRFHPTVSSGSGLGLYLVSQNVKVLDGSINYVPHHDGSEFILELPTLNKTASP